MKVICIDSSNQLNDGTPDVIEGQIYTVIGETSAKQSYILEGMDRGDDCICDLGYGIGGYRKTRFIPLSEIDETELAKEREQGLIKL